MAVCSVLSQDELEKFADIARPACFAPRQMILRQDEPCDFVYNITGGAGRLSRVLTDGRRQIVGFLLPGDFLGLSMSERSAYSVDAMTPIHACRFSRTQFSAFLDAHPSMMRSLYERASHELSLAQEQMTIIGRRTAEERVVCFLFGLRARWARIGSDSVNIPLPMTRQDIADFLGLTIETVSRAISKLAREKSLVVTPDGVRMLDPDRLAQMAAG
jgi:CRP/FNR family transcriptional regulator